MPPIEGMFQGGHHVEIGMDADTARRRPKGEKHLPPLAHSKKGEVITLALPLSCGSSSVVCVRV